jgi:hypothetical protein
MSKTRKGRSPRTLNSDHGGLIPAAELFARPGELPAADPGPPLTPDEQFRERVTAAWAWVKTVRFREHEHERLARMLMEMITAGNR